MVELLSKMATSQLCILEYFSINLSNSLSATNYNLLHIQLILFLWCFFSFSCSLCLNGYVRDEGSFTYHEKYRQVARCEVRRLINCDSLDAFFLIEDQRSCGY